jgi:hypothetical protein
MRAGSSTSLVRCVPKTGRTHQIRAHLAHLGHPIANDGAYGGARGHPRPQWLVRRRGDHAEPPAATSAGDGGASVGDSCAANGHARPAAAAASDAATAAVDFVGGGRGAGVAEGGAEAHPAAPLATTAAASAAAAEHSQAQSDAARSDEQQQQHQELDGNDANGPAPQPRTPPHKRQRTQSDAADYIAPAAATTPARPSLQSAQDRLDLPLAGTAPVAARTDLAAAEAAASAALVPPERRSATCEHCPLLSPRDYPLDLQALWLHAEAYECEDWSYSAPRPAWAAEGFDTGARDSAAV